MSEMQGTEPEVTPIDLQFKRNKELTEATIAKIIEHFSAAYNETLSFGAAYWERQGNKGASQVQVFGFWKQVILNYYGSDLPETLSWVSTAGDTLTVNQDGTVTIGGQ